MLAFVIFVDALYAIYEDCKRHEDDQGRDGARDDRTRDLAGAAHRRVLRRVPVLGPSPEDVLTDVYASD